MIDLNVAGTDMFQKTLTWLETGINDQAGDRRTENFTKGMKLLYPGPIVRKIKSVESQMRQLIGNYIFQVTGFYPYRWLLYTAYDQWREKFDRLVAEFEAIKAGMIDRHGEYVEKMADEYDKVASAGCNSLTSGGNYRALKIQRRGQILSMTRQEFIQAKLQAGYVTALVYGEADIAADRGDAQLAWERTRQEVKRTRLENQLLKERLRQETWKGQMDQREREIRIRAMRDAEMQHARQQLSEIASPIAEVFTALRARFAADAASLLERIQKNCYVRGKVAEKGRGLIEVCYLLAIHDDTELRSAFAQLKALLGPISDDESCVSTFLQAQGSLGQVLELSSSLPGQLEAFGVFLPRAMLAHCTGNIDF